MQTVNSLIVIEDISELPPQVPQGTTMQRQIKVKNLGNQPTELDLWIAPTDNQSELLWKWCTFSEANPLRVSPYEEQTVTLTFDVPPSATIGIYGYEILAETRFPTAGQLVRRSQQLWVVRSDHLGRDSVPRFTVQPATHAAQPLEISVGELQTLTVQVENRSRRVDRFYLICPDLDPAWGTLQYPESNPDIPGLVSETDGLELNPGAVAAIHLCLHPPAHAPAGTYFPTLQLISTIRDDLVLLDVVYLKILPHDHIEAEIQPCRRRIPEDGGDFAIRLFNQGNRQRQLTLLAYDAEHLFDYLPGANTIDLSPGEQGQVTLLARPRKWWRRPWWGKGLNVTFDLGLDPLETPANYALPMSLPQGTLVWQPRPLWHLGLLLVLLLGTAGAIALTLWYVFFKPEAPPPMPQVTAFGASEAGYQEGRSPIRLDWEISSFSNLQKIVLTRMADGVETYRKSYGFNPGAAQPLPPELRPRRHQSGGFCEVLDAAPPTDQLRCQEIVTADAAAGNHVFKLQVFSIHSPDQPVEVVLTDSIAVAPPDPAPAIATFTSTHAAYAPAAAPAAGDRVSGPILLDWAIAQPEQIQALQLVGVATDGTIQSPAQTYSFEQGMPAPLRPFCTMSTTLQCSGVPTPIRDVGNYVFRLTVVPRRPSETPITQTTATIPITPPPPQISSFRINGQEVTANPKLVLAIAPPPSSDADPDSAPEASPDADTAAATTAPSPQEIILSWEVEGSDGITVELLPAPGIVPPEGTMAYPLSASRRETITLRVTNAAGEQVSQTAVVETARPPQADGAESRSASPTDMTPDEITDRITPFIDIQTDAAPDDITDRITPFIDIYEGSPPPSQPE